MSRWIAPLIVTALMATGAYFLTLALTPQTDCEC